MNAAIFPGQGAQLVGMGKDVAERFPAAREVFAAADETLGIALSQLCFEGPEERLGATDIQQPAIFTTSVALYRAAVEAGVVSADSFGMMGGLSLGEYTALHLAGAIDFADALKLVYRRGQLMQECAEKYAGGMASLMGADEARALALCERVAEKGRCRPANFNCPGQIVISGEAAAVEAAVALADEFELRAIPLKVAGAFHSDLMRDAAEALQETLAATPVRATKVRVTANVDGEYHGGPDEIRQSLYRQVFNPVRWQECVQRMIADRVEQFFEIGPNRVLTGLNRKIDRNAKTTNISTAAAFEG